jgi:hypothetical protein
MLESFTGPLMQQPQQQQHPLRLVQGQHSPPGQQLGAGMQLQLEHDNGLTQLADKPSCAEGRCLFNNLVSQLSLAACEVQLEHMALRTSSSSSTSTSISSRSSSVSGHAVSPHAPDQAPDSVPTRSSTLSPDAFQELLFRMLQEEWSTHVQGSGE